MVDNNNSKEPTEDDYALMILRNRLAKGEITVEEFNKLKNALAITESLAEIKKEIRDVSNKVNQIRQNTNQKSQRTTLILSTVLGLFGLLGIGHFYVGSKGKGAIFLVAGLFLDLIIILFVTAPILLPQNPGFAQFQQSVMITSAATVYGLIYLGLYFIQMFDVVKSCRKYNLSLLENKKISLRGLMSSQEKILLGIILTILVIGGASTVHDISVNSQKMNILKQEQQRMDQQAQYAQTLEGSAQAYQKWRECSQKAGEGYLSICGNPPQSPFDTVPLDCSSGTPDLRCNPYYDQQAIEKKYPNSIQNSSSQKQSGQNSIAIQTPQSNALSHPSGDTAVIYTKFGGIMIKLRDDVAPKTVANFEKLSQSGFYDGTIFHRIVPGFVIQGGDPNTIKGPRNTWGLGNAGYTIPPEFSKLEFSKYMVGMARSSDVNSGSSQFFITVGDNAQTLNSQYTLFGEVIYGQEDVVDKIASLRTNSDSQPVDVDSARVIKIVIQK